MKHEEEHKSKGDVLIGMAEATKHAIQSICILASSFHQSIEIRKTPDLASRGSSMLKLSAWPERQMHLPCKKPRSIEKIG